MKSMSNEKFNQESNSFLKDENEVHEKEDTKCGYGVFKGKWLNKFADQNSFLFVYSITGMLTGAFFTYYSGTTSTIEKHFKFSSTQIGFIGAFYQLFSTFVSLIVPYFCAKGRIPKWLGLSVLCYGIAGVMYSLPYFVVGPNDDILSMTVEYGDGSSLNRTSEDLFNNELCHNSSKLNYFGFQ